MSSYRALGPLHLYQQAQECEGRQALFKPSPLNLPKSLPDAAVIADWGCTGEDPACALPCLQGPFVLSLLIFTLFLFGGVLILLFSFSAFFVIAFVWRERF